ncbi:MAG: hypothetical protein ACKOUT_08725 [Novosphingobium sp.]
MVSQFHTGSDAAVTPLVRTAARPQTRNPARHVPMTSGNLALAAPPSDDDWTEF